MRNITVNRIESLVGLYIIAKMLYPYIYKVHMHFRELYVGLLIDLQKITCISELILHYLGKVKEQKRILRLYNLILLYVIFYSTCPCSISYSNIKVLPKKLFAHKIIEWSLLVVEIINQKFIVLVYYYKKKLMSKSTCCLFGKE